MASADGVRCCFCCEKTPPGPAVSHLLRAARQALDSIFAALPEAASMEELHMKREEVKELVDRGIRELNEALAAGKSDRLRAYLDVLSRFPRYSFNNCILIAVQAPEATMVQGFQAWKKLGRNVVKGEKGIGIIAPMIGKRKDEDGNSDESEGKTVFGFKVVHVFDVSQTEGEDLPEFAEVSGDPGENIEAVENLIRSHGINLLYEAIPGGADGVSKKGTIVISPELPPANRLATLVHELSHELMHLPTDRRKETTKTIRETEAEAVAHVVCQALGLDTLYHCTDYIHLYDGDADVLTRSLDHIQKTAAEILEGVKSHMRIDAEEGSGMSGRIRLGCGSCDRTDFDFISELPTDWEGRLGSSKLRRVDSRS